MPERPQRPEAFTSRWDESIQSYDVLVEKSTKSEIENTQPVQLEIMYSAGADYGNELIHEVVYVDKAVDQPDPQGPRLLVSVQAISALRRICQLDFERFQGTLAVLNECRVAYYKELIYLREQLKLLRNKGVVDPVDEHVHNYECYWYNPPVYVDEELRDFLLTCIRLTNKKVIEENYRLVRQLQDQGNATRIDDDTKLKALMRGMGAGGIVRKIGEFCSSKQQSDDFMKVIREFAAKDQSGKVSSSDSEKKMLAMQEELEQLRIRSRENDELRQRLSALEAKTRDLEQRLAKETTRAEEEKKRGDEAERLCAALKQDVAKLTTTLKDAEARLAQEQRRCQDLLAAGADNEAEQGRLVLKALPGACERILAIATQIDSATVGSSKITSSNKSIGVYQLEEAVTALDKAWKASQALMRKQKENSDRPKVSVAEKGLQVSIKAGASESRDAEIETLRAELVDLRAELEQMRAQLTNVTHELKAAEETIEQLSVKISIRDERIAKLKAEVKRLKQALGEPEDEDDDADDEDLPDFLLAYWRRIRGVSKPRWMLLSEDASCQQVKRTYDCSLLRHDANEARVALAFLTRRGSVHQYPWTRNSVVSMQEPQQAPALSKYASPKYPASVEEKVIELHHDLEQTVSGDAHRKFTPRPSIENVSIHDLTRKSGDASRSTSPVTMTATSRIEANIKSSSPPSRSPALAKKPSRSPPSSGRSRSPPITIRQMGHASRPESRFGDTSYCPAVVEDRQAALARVVIGEGLPERQRARRPVGENEPTARQNRDTHRNRASYAEENEPTARQPHGDQLRWTSIAPHPDVKHSQAQKQELPTARFPNKSPALAPLQQEQAQLSTERSKRTSDKSQNHALGNIMVRANAVPKVADVFSGESIKAYEQNLKSDKTAQSASSQLQREQAQVSPERPKRTPDKLQTKSSSDLMIRPNAAAKVADGPSEEPIKADQQTANSDKLAQTAPSHRSWGAFGKMTEKEPTVMSTMTTTGKKVGLQKQQDDVHRPATAPPIILSSLHEPVTLHEGTDSSGGLPLGFKKPIPSTKFPRALSAGTIRTPAANTGTAVLRPSSSVGCRRVASCLPLTNVGRSGLQGALQSSEDEVRTVLPGVSPALPPGRVRKGFMK